VIITGRLHLHLWKEEVQCQAITTGLLHPRLWKEEAQWQVIITGPHHLRLWKGGGINKITIGALHPPLCRERGKIIGHLVMEEVQSRVNDKIIGQP
jgi:hypothetical protein